jgi:tetratricopeptide (TPR) repeat protein
MSTRTGAIMLALAAFCPAARAGGQAGDFLSQETGARGAALGGAMTALTDDVSSLQWNPAGLARLSKPEVSATHVTLFEDTSYDFVAGGMASRRWGGFGAAYVRQSSGGFEKRTSPNDAATTFSIVDSAWLLGWGYSVKQLDLGVTVKSVHEQIDTFSAGGAGADAGAIWRPGGGWLVGLRVGNLIAPKLRFVSETVPYARVYDLSPAYTFHQGRDWDTTLAIKFTKTAGEGGLTAAGGAEVRYGRLAALRLGMQDKGFTVGAGLQLGNSSFDYAALMHELGLSHLITFTQRFGHTKEELEETIRRGISELSKEQGVRLSKAYLAKADDELRMDRTQEALRDLEAASLLDPENTGLREQIQKVSEKWDRSLRRQMVERTSALAQQNQTQGNLLAARAYWKSVLELEPESTAAVENLREIDRTLSQEERSKLDDLRKAQSVNEQQQLLTLATGHLARDRYRQARLEAEKAAARFPNAPEFPAFIVKVKRQLEEYVTLKLDEADKAAQAGNLAEGVRVVEAALREDPGNAKLTERAVALRASLQRTVTPEARKQIEQMYYRAVEQYLRGDFAAAGELAKEVYRLDPTFEGARTLREKIDAAQRYQK